MNPQIKALREILKMAMEHPAFDKVAFESRDIDSLVKQGGDICDWTMVGVIAADTIEEQNK